MLLIQFFKSTRLGRDIFFSLGFAVLLLAHSRPIIACPFDSHDHPIIRMEPGVGAVRPFGWVSVDANGKYYPGGRNELGHLVPVTDPNLIFNPSDPRALMGFPENPDSISQNAYHKIIDDIAGNPQSIYHQMAASQGARLVIYSFWENNTLNAYAQQVANDWILWFYGGLARHPQTTEDGFAFIVCHELGHHFGGFPFYDFLGIRWASAEGQADYFAANVCLKDYFRSSDAQIEKTRAVASHFLRNEVNEPSKSALHQKCAFATGQTPGTLIDNYAVCIRTGLASQSLANLLAALVNQPFPHFHTPDPTIVNNTVSTHPTPQCRLDTGFSGALCSVDSHLQLEFLAVPGKGIQNKWIWAHAPIPQSDVFRQEREASFFSCARKFDDANFGLWNWPSNSEPWGYRQRCWHKPESFYGPYFN